MDNPRPAKVAVVREVRERLSSSSGAILTEYRGLKVGELAALRRSLRDGGDARTRSRARARSGAGGRIAGSGCHRAGLGGRERGHAERARDPHRHDDRAGVRTMATLSKDEILDAIASMTVLELSELLKD